jgi:hypothetical protein
MRRETVLTDPCSEGETMRRLAIWMAVALMATIGTLLGITSPAAAGRPFANCPSGIACVYTGPSGSGTPLQIPISKNPVYTCLRFPAGYYNNISSATNTYGMYDGHTLWLKLWNGSHCVTDSSNYAYVVNFDSESFGTWDWKSYEIIFGF